jgi:hypothetical protein
MNNYINEEGFMNKIITYYLLVCSVCLLSMLLLVHKNECN